MVKFKANLSFKTLKLKSWKLNGLSVQISRVRLLVNDVRKLLQKCNLPKLVKVNSKVENNKGFI